LRYINGNANKYQRKKQPYLKNTLLLCEANQGRKAVNEIKYNKMENRELTPEQKAHKTELLKFGELCHIADLINNISERDDEKREKIFEALKVLCEVSKKWKCTPENFSNKFDVSRETI
jgi:hypothetical protein